MRLRSKNLSSQAVREQSIYLRFVVGGDGEHHKLLTGLITEARRLRDKGELAAYEDEQLESIYTWLNSHLPCPPFSTAGWPRDAVSWFKHTAKESIERMRSLAVVLEAHGKQVRVLRSANPGKILYEDPFQVVVEEWKRL
jgi:hypothetical protein